MGDGKTIFSFVLSTINFLFLAFAFNHVVVWPMIGAVKVRAAKVLARLKESGSILEEARKTEANYKDQFSRLAASEEELREASRLEIERVVHRISMRSQADAEHVVAKAKREAEKMRVDALAQMQHKIVVQALSKVEDIMRKNIDASGHDDLNQRVLSKVGSLRAS